jgi:hypothetical protein
MLNLYVTLVIHETSYETFAAVKAVSLNDCTQTQ